MRLIDADALREHMYHEAFETDTKEQRWDSGCWIRYKMFERIIDSEIAIDPMKHGRWEFEPGMMYCSSCGWLYDYYAGLEEEYNYCPNCGARMEGEEDDSDKD